MKILSGTELAGYIKERQAKQVRGLLQAHSITPKLAIVRTTDDPVIDTYVRLKKAYGADIQAEVEVHNVDQADAAGLIEDLNSDMAVHGIILQLPLANIDETDEIISHISKDKDVDGLREDTLFDPATPVAINWLLNGYNVEMRDKKIAIIGRGKLVGAPLFKLFAESGYNVESYDDKTPNISEKIASADVVVSATGSPGLIKSPYLKTGAVAVDAGVAVEAGQNVGDFAEDVYERDDLTVTPRRGGVGPLTVSALFDNLIIACQGRV